MEYSWLAIYSNGRALPQYRADGKENKYADIDRKLITQFVFLIKGTERRVLTLHVPDGKRLIFRRRTEQWGNETNQKRNVWMVGTQSTVNGKNSQVVIVLFPDGSTEIMDGFNEETRWHSSPQWVACEEKWS